MRRHFAVLTFFVMAFACLGVSAQEACPESSTKSDATMVGDFGFFTITAKGVLLNKQAFFPFDKETRIPVEDDIRNSFGPFGTNYRISTRVAIKDPKFPTRIILIELVRQRRSGYISSWVTTNLDNFSDGISFRQTIIQINNWGTTATSATYSVTDPLLDDPNLINDTFFMKKTDMIQAFAKHPAFTVQNLSDPRFMEREDMRGIRKIIDDNESGRKKSVPMVGYFSKDHFKFSNCLN